ncbi:hypothetical protein RYX36_024725 [Vicia faba]
MASSLCLFLLYSVILQSAICVAAQTKSTIAIGDSHTAESNTSPWLLSPSGDFAFGFLPLNDTNLFLLSIWYAKISENTVVWYANGDSPAPKGSKVELNANDGLVLTSPNGVGLWNTTEVLNSGVSRGVFNDTGNFVLQDGDFNSLWETFKHPNDNLLPSQVIDKGVKLSSKLKERNFSKGRFELLLQSDGNLVMHSINLPSGYTNENYYESQTVGSNKSSAGTQLVFDSSGELYVLRENNEKFNMSGKDGEDDDSSKVSTTDFYLRATLNLDGVFSLFKHPKSSTDSSGWTIVWSHPENICSYIAVAGSGVCGYNSVCALGDDKRPRCQCPKSYSLVDPDDPYGSCKPDFIQGCVEDDLYDFEILTETDWPLSDYVSQKPFTEEHTSMILQYEKKLRRVSRSDTSVETNLRYFTYKELEKAANGFDKELGRGSFGIVYEGVINNNTCSETRVAVKKLNNFLLDQAHKEFRNEVNGIGLTHHKNLVRLLGFCEGGSERLLVYEYMSNGTLANFLFNSFDKKQRPSWKLRLEIAIGVARGLVYLHEECITRIIHCDIKPQNILLDDNFNARISDFGLAKLLNMNESKTNTGIRGTKGYVAVEWFKNMPITTMVDVYSYGVVLLEIISCRRCVQEMDQGEEEKAILTDWAYDCYRDGAVDALVVGDNEALDDKEKLEKLVMIAIWCVQEDPVLRPSMRNVIHMLEGTVEVQIPPYPSPVSIQYSLI